MSQNKSRSANRLLSSLPEIEYQRLEPYLTTTTCSSKELLYEASEKIETVYFPQTALISLVSTLKDGATTEVSLVGGTGMVGLPVILGSGRSNFRAIVQIPDGLLKISARILKQEFERGGELQRLLLRYTEDRVNETAQLALCNRYHTIEERLARWLLVVSDLTQSELLPVTQEFIGNMLGCRRSGVTIAAGTLKQAGIIGYSRGRITILDREALEDTSCECYRLLYHNFYRH